MAYVLRPRGAALLSSKSRQYQRCRGGQQQYATLVNRFSVTSSSSSSSSSSGRVVPTTQLSGVPRRALSDTKTPEDVLYLPMPKLSPGMTSGKIRKWLKAEGDEINEYDPILELSTDSLYDEGQAPGDPPTEMIVEITEAGYVGKIFAREGELVEAGVPIMAMCEEKESVDAAKETPRPDVDLNATDALEKYRIASFQAYLNGDKNKK